MNWINLYEISKVQLVQTQKKKVDSLKFKIGTSATFSIQNDSFILMALRASPLSTTTPFLWLINEHHNKN